MLPSPSSSPQQPLENRTNLPPKGLKVQTSLKSFLLTPPDEKKPKRQALLTSFGPNKRIKLELSSNSLDSEDASSSDSDYEDSDDDVEMAVQRPQHPFQQQSRLLNRPGGHVNVEKLRPSTNPILRSFVSSHKADVFKCTSTNPDRYLTPPYACAYSNRSKHGTESLLAVADEEGTVTILNTTKRRDWDDAPPTKKLHSHQNGVFQVKWSEDDETVATCSGDQSIRITNIETSAITHVLRGQTSTVKVVSWDPAHRHLLASGSRDGTINVWDLRMGETYGEDGLQVVKPCQSIQRAHLAKQGRKAPKKKSLPVPGITSILYPEGHTYGIVSSATSDGVLKYWDLRFLTDRTPSKRGRGKGRGKPKAPAELFSTELDPTTLHGSRRPRGILSITTGRGPTAGLVFALGADSRIHTYSLPTLQPYTNASRLHNNSSSFYVTLSVSPCGRWLASGGADGKASLFDVANSPFGVPAPAVELKAQEGEVGAVDWSHDALATCADEGTVRIWRPDIDVYRQCLEDPEESRWNWAWSSS
ncbi:cell division cycle protein cdt2 [Coprinopsis cinerea okayama7|uniref:Cell division cycle protein cdt2 n=1 Tax=Coprinopsis cinerea (strain Okayama-7 / 130 / ATCC MYA-4618 / FGSC 9003) TaxID=240176 RepID=A8NWK7_COPC7|nr:cell division cycle protein cdt2 [Coprinopsis cinerea okayama7\|eukprot:XP_001836918.2 cell division cycle protein cdt2 [Coprinopsis cinerea okayama7\